MTKELTLCLMTCGEETEKECLTAIEPYRDQFTYQEVRNIAPQTKALNMMITNCKTPYLTPLDADFILNSNFLERMDSKINQFRSDKKWHSILFPMWDSLTCQKVRSLKIFQTHIVKKIPYKNTIHPDYYHWHELQNAGYYAHEFMNEEAIGRHVVSGNERCYLRYKDILLCKRKILPTSKIRDFARENILFFFKKYIETKNNDYVSCICGIYDGFMSKKNLSLPKSYLDKEIIYGPDHLNHILREFELNNLKML